MPLPAGTGPVTQQIPMVLNDAGVIGLSLNGKSFPATAPVMAKVGEWVEITYCNEGMQIHPMHLHGVPQLVIAKDGFPVPAAVPGRHDRGRAGRALHGARAPHGGLPRAERHARASGRSTATSSTTPRATTGMFGMVTTFIVTP